MSASISVKQLKKEHPINVIDKSASEMYRLQNQNRNFTQREKKKFSPYFNYNDTNTFDITIMENLINNEIHTVCSNKGWKMLPKSMKWDAINLYFDSDIMKSSFDVSDIITQKEKLRKALIADKTIKLDYDVKNKIIIKIYDL